MSRVLRDISACIAAWTRAAEMVTSAAEAARDAYRAVQKSVEEDEAEEKSFAQAAKLEASLTARAVWYVVPIRDGGCA